MEIILWKSLITGSLPAYKVNNAWTWPQKWSCVIEFWNARFLKIGVWTWALSNITRFILWFFMGLEEYIAADLDLLLASLCRIF